MTQTIDPAHWQDLGSPDQLQTGGLGLRFEVRSTLNQQPCTLPAFVIAHAGKPYAYLNQCAHVAMELDWQAGQFFDSEGEHLICASHGALYRADTGVCVAGPCLGKQLTPVPLKIHNSTLYVSTTL